MTRPIPSSLQPPLPILINILSFTKLTINDYNGACGVNRTWCHAATHVPNAIVQFVHPKQYNMREQFGTCQWRAHLNRLPTAITDPSLLHPKKGFPRWINHNPILARELIRMSPYLLAIRKYPRAASFHDFPFTGDLTDLLPPNSNDPMLINGDLGVPVYTGPLLLSHKWKLSQLRSLNLRVDDRHQGEYQSGDHPAFFALDCIIAKFAQKKNSPKTNQKKRQLRPCTISSHRSNC
jgi:hypothetical protein